ncbi:hypothetical protein VNO78_10829 [Psophocarpus tetragonolobus]|uniref:Uncharacterized protein n=1 Tax=Psophocarpus tetragonolobus TaxID=3891 RepID=A0AAN9SKQ2_PSOTE
MRHHNREHGGESEEEEVVGVIGGSAKGGEGEKERVMFRSEGFEERFEFGRFKKEGGEEGYQDSMLAPLAAKREHPSLSFSSPKPDEVFGDLSFGENVPRFENLILQSRV